MPEIECHGFVGTYSLGFFNKQAPIFLTKGDYQINAVLLEVGIEEARNALLTRMGKPETSLEKIISDIIWVLAFILETNHPLAFAMRLRNDFNFVSNAVIPGIDQYDKIICKLSCHLIIHGFVILNDMPATIGFVHCGNGIQDLNADHHPIKTID
jgi:hypothetical protein